MDPIAALADRLLYELEFRSVEELEIAKSLPSEFSKLDFLGMRTYFDSLIAVGLVSADDLEAQDVADRFDWFQMFFDRLLEIGPTMRGLVIDNLTGRSGLLGYVFRTPPTRDRIEQIRALRHGSAAKLGYCLAWVVDVQNVQIHRHRGLPFKVYPGKRFFQKALQELTRD